VLSVLLVFCASTAIAVEENPSAQGVSASEDPSRGPVLQDHRVSGPYCGIQSLFVCLDTLGIATDINDYIKTDYVGSFQGSSAEELIQAAEDFGARAKCFSHVTHRELQRIGSPVVLHMRGNWADGGFNHWVAFLGVEGSRARIVDAPHPLQTMGIAELLANWDGIAIVVEREEVSEAFVAAARLDYLLAVAVLLLIALFLQMVFSRYRIERQLSVIDRGKAVLLQAGAILGVAVVFALAYHSCAEIGFLRNPTALAEVTRRHYSVDIPELTMAQTEKEITEGKPLVLDARRVIDYQRGALPGAKSMSLYSTLPERQDVLTGVPKSQRIIVYCQSSRCGYADEVAKFLKFNGHENLAIYRDGWREWKNKRPSPNLGVVPARAVASKPPSRIARSNNAVDLRDPSTWHEHEGRRGIAQHSD
jgi:rhodanese-related sulfurtransferase